MNQYAYQIGKTCDLVRLNNGVKSAIFYISPILRIKATRRNFAGKYDRRCSDIDVILTIGKPNYEERIFVNECKKAKEPFPLKKIQLKYFKGFN